MKAPREKALPYTIVVVIAAIVIFGVIGALGSCFLTRPVP
jgi:VIT1/CCC1 family predicted Fe2+/Mn2+ transporter